MNALDVYFHADRIGRLGRLPGARLQFAYDAAWAQNDHAPLSLSLPLRTEAYDDDDCRPFFSGLLPEGEFLKYADAHSKNYSLMLEGEESPRLAPFYDLLSTRTYGRFTRKMAMKYGGEDRPERVRGRHLDRLAGDLGIPPRGVRRRIAELLERVTASSEVARRQLPERWQAAPTIDGIAAVIEEMSGLLQRASAESA
jgi:HipA-like protein